MSGELVPSQFRYTTTNNRDFVIGDPTDSVLDQPKYLVFQMTNLPGYNNNPHIKAEKISGNFKLSLSQNGSTTLNFAYVDAANTFTATNVFQNTTSFTNSITGAAASFTTLTASSLGLSGNLTVGGDLAVNGTTTTLNVANVTINDKNIILNRNGIASTGTGAGISIEEAGSNTGYFQTSSNRLGWDLKAPGASGILVLQQNGSGVTTLIGTGGLSSTLYLPSVISGTLALLTDIPGAVDLSPYVTLSTNQSITGTKTFNTLNATTLNGNLLGSLDGLTLPGTGADGQMLTKAGSAWVWTTPSAGGGTDANAVHLTGTETIQTAKHFFNADLYFDKNSGAASGEGVDSKLQFRRSSTGAAPWDITTHDFGDIKVIKNATNSGQLQYTMNLGNGIVSPAAQPGMMLTRNYTANKVSLEIVTGGTAGSSIILADKTTGVRYEIYMNNGVLSVAAA